MNDVAFPEWVVSSPAFASARALSAILIKAYETQTAAPASTPGVEDAAGSADAHGRLAAEADSALASERDTDAAVDAAVPLAAPRMASRTGALEADPRVLRLLALSHLEEVAPAADVDGGKGKSHADTGDAPDACLTFHPATAILGLYALVVSLRVLPPADTAALFQKLGRHYLALVSRLGRLRFAAGVDMEGFVSALVACGLKMRAADEVAGFDTEAVDQALLRCIPEDIDQSAQNAVALGVLHGFSNTYSREPVALGAALVGRLHDLMDAFAVSPHRRDLPYKKLLSALLEAISCSAVIDFGRTNNWITAIIQETYVVRGLFQRELLHSRVVAAALTLLIRQYQEMVVDQSLNGTDTSAPAMPDFSEGDELIELVWRALQGGLSVWDTNTSTSAVSVPPTPASATTTTIPAKRDLTLYVTNVQAVVQALLRTEMARLNSYFTITRSASGGAARSQYGEALPYTPSAEEESLRVRVASNIIKLLLLPSSVMRAATLANNAPAAQLCAVVTAMGTRVLSAVTSREFYHTPSRSGAAHAAGLSLSAEPAQQQQQQRYRANYSNLYYSQAQTVVEQLIAVVLESESREESESSAAAACLNSLCASDESLCRFAVTQVTDTIIGASATIKAGAKLAALVDAAETDAAAERKRRRSAKRKGAARRGETAGAAAATTDGGAAPDAQTTAQRKSAKHMAVYLQTLCHIVVPLQNPAERPLTLAELERYGQLLSDTYEDSLRDAIALQGRAMLTEAALKGRRAVGPMAVAAAGFHELVLRLHQRGQSLVKEALAAVQAAPASGALSSPEATATWERYKAAVNRESDGVLTLMRVAMRCIVDVAWPGSGILYQQGAGHVLPFSSSTSAEAMAPLALACIEPFLRPLTLLFRMATVFPVAQPHDLREFARDADAGAMAELPNNARSVLYQFQPTKLHAPLYEALGLSEFRSCWLLMSHYGFTAQALSDAGEQLRRGSELAGAVAAHHTGARLLSSENVTLIRLLAAAAVPLMLMQSTDMHQATADIASMLRYVDPAIDPSSASGPVHSGLHTSLRRLCGSGGWHKLSVAELVLMRSLVELEMLRASAGSIACLTLYQHFEVREFVASPAIRDVLGAMMGSVSALFEGTLHSVVPTLANRLVNLNTPQLVLLLCFSLASVRDAAREILELIVRSFASYSVDGTGLPLLWSIMNLIAGGSRAAIEKFCSRANFYSAPAVPGEPGSVERNQHLSAIAEVAEQWVARARAEAPQALFELAFRYVVQQDRRDHGSSALSGSQMAVAAAQMSPPSASSSSASPSGATTSTNALLSEAPNYAHQLIRVSSAQGEMRAALRFVAMEDFQAHAVQRVIAALSRCRCSTSTPGGVAERLRKIYNALFALPAAPGSGNSAEHPAKPSNDDKDDKDEEERPRQRARLHHTLLSEADAAMSTAAALLLSGSASPSTTQMLLQSIVQGPILCFDSALIEAAFQCWRWLLVSAREQFLLPIVQQLVEGVIATLRAGVGLLDGHYAPQDEEVQTGNFSSTEQCNRRYTDDYPSNSPHSHLFAFMTELFVSVSSPFAFEPEVLRSLCHLCLHLLDDPNRFSLKDSSFAEYMRCMLFIGNVLRNVHTANSRRLRAGLPSVTSFTSVGALRHRWYLTLLRWFRKSPPSWYFSREPALSVGEMAVVEELIQLLQSEASVVGKNVLGFVDFSVVTKKQVRDPEGLMTNVWCTASCMRKDVPRDPIDDDAASKLMKQEATRLRGLLSLLVVLMKHELARMKVWLNPRRALTFGIEMPADGRWPDLVAAAVSNDPQVAVAMVARFSYSKVLRRIVSEKVVAHPETFAHVLGAVDLYLTEEVLKAGATRLFLFRPCLIVSALRLLDARYTRYATVASFAINSLMAQRSEDLIFYLPQLLQVLATDDSGAIRGFLVRMSQRSTMFCHQLLWSLRTEGEGDSALARRCRDLATEVVALMDAEQRRFYEREFEFTDLVTSVSGELMKFDKPQRKPKLRERLRDDCFHAAPTTEHIYLPTDPEWRIIETIPHTAGAMQSAAKCPILVQFKCVPRESEDTSVARSAEEGEEEGQHRHGGADTFAPVVKGCIFKMGDDCRQDQISLQLMGLMQRILSAAGVPFYLYPYRVVTTGRESGIIEVVPNSLSRNEIGKLVESNLAEYYVQRFGHPETVAFSRAREQFIQSVASYSVVSYILNIKDRHNGNIMIDKDGHLVHIDFGFLFDTSPGGDINFESSPFKLTTEMVQLIGLDVGRSNLRSEALTKALVCEDAYVHFKVLVNRCFLAVRQYAREICILVELMLHSGLPCFKPKQTVADVAHRLGMGMDEVQAAEYMRGRIHEARQHYRTVLYDFYQKVAEGIEM